MQGKVIILITAGLLIAAFLVLATFLNLTPKDNQADAKATERPINGDPLDPKNLPMGDGRVSAAPKKGFVMSCQSRFFGGGAFRDGEWIRGNGTWDSTGKPTVEGDVAWAGKYEIRVEDAKRKLIGNGLPDHNTGIFPIGQNSEAYKYDRNPNSIAENRIVFELPLVPQIAEAPSCVPMGAIGVMRSGVVIFNALDGGGKDAVAHEIQDKCDGHPEIEGQYHYHNLSKCIEEKKANKHSELVGYALDGFGIFGRYGEGGKELTNADLDECHGHTHEILWDSEKINIYHYHATMEYPYTVGCFKGKPVSSN